MREAVRAELLRLRSGWWTAIAFGYAVLLPYLIWSYAPDEVAGRVGEAAASGSRMWLFLMATPLTAGWIGSWLISRDYHYRTSSRLAWLTTRRASFVAGCLAGAIAGLVVAVAGVFGWGALIWQLQRGDDPYLGGLTWSLAAGCVLACVLAGVWGVLLTRLCANYYVATAITFGLPLAVELPLVLTWPELGGYLPDAVLALTISVVPGDFRAPVAFLPWLAGVGALAWWSHQRREHI
ncbi:hypothetical protein [Crossiella cryophila]|uniref:Succinate dehydrogenase hydrophobic anchor subunit n=1 Tax=Crossiella cryophila TaxID=43355 RepID=A0A7W7FVD4_9PSEU|nr:hypothetical protein [Crossiella cryophila]MBB4678383.1 succinate dehydrogenase hydrophobic anchor subunit [Crossiella cryophila]